MRQVRRRRLACLIALALPLRLLAADAEPIYDIHLEAGPLLGCLEQLSVLANVAIIDRSGQVAEALCSQSSRRATLAAALDSILTPNGLVWRRRDDQAIEILAAVPREQVNLSALTIEDTPLPSLAPVTAASPPVTAMVHDAMSVTRVEQDRLDTAPFLSLNQIGRYAPNVYASGASLAIRGQERDLDIFSGLSVRLDGIDLGTALIEGDMVPLEGVASMEIQRGPRSFERGGSATAGALDLYTAAPAPTPTLRASAGIGNGGALRGATSYSDTFGDSESSVRVALERRVMPNYVREVHVPEANSEHRTVDNAYAKLNLVPESLPGASMEVSLLGVTGDDPALYTAAGLFPVLSRERKSFARDTSRTRTQAFGSALGLQYGRDEWNVRLNANSTVAQQKGQWMGSGFGPSGDLNSERRRAVSLSGRYTLENWEMAAGAEVSAVSFADRDAVWVDGFRRLGDNRQDMDFRTRSAWLWLGRHWGERFSAGVGLRHVKEKAQQNYRSVACDVPETDFIPRPGICADRDPTLLFQTFGRVDTSTPVPMLVGNWQISPVQRLSLSHGRGIRSSAGVRSEWIQPAERDDSTQLSWQASWWEERLKLRTTLFHTLVRERFHYVTNHVGARGRVYGSEVELEARLGRLWQATLGLGRLRARYDYYRYYNQDPTPRLPGAPNHTALFGLRYGDGSGWYGSLDAYHTAEAESTLDINPGNRRPAYTLADIRIGYRLPEADFSIAVTNATDALYLDRVDFRYNDRREETRYRLGDPRRVELRWMYEWQ